MAFSVLMANVVMNKPLNSDDNNSQSENSTLRWHTIAARLSCVSICKCKMKDVCGLIQQSRIRLFT